MVVMRPAGFGRISILVASTGGLHGDIGLSAYAASKGGLLAFGRSLAVEGAGMGGCHEDALLPYALTQMTADGISDDEVRRRMQRRRRWRLYRPHWRLRTAR